MIAPAASITAAIRNRDFISGPGQDIILGKLYGRIVGWLLANGAVASAVGRAVNASAMSSTMLPSAPSQRCA